MLNCPVCRQVLPKPLPPFCDHCGWDLENDLTLVASLDPIPENVQNKYTQRLEIAKRVWQERGESKEKAEEYFKSAKAAYQKGDYDRAIADYTRAIAMKPGATTYHNRGCPESTIKASGAVTDG